MANLFQELLFTSRGTAAYFKASATSDIRVAVTEEAGFGAFFAEDPRWLKTVKEVRVDARANTASTISFGISPTLGSAMSEVKAVTLSASSTYGHSLLTFDTEARYPYLRLTSNDGSQWRIAMLYLMAERKGN